MIELRASSLGSCTRAQAASILGMKAVPVSDQMQALYDRGNEHEDLCLLALARDGWLVEHDMLGYEVDEGQIYIRLPIGDDIVITGHLDGACFQDPLATRRVLEIKATSTYQSFYKAFRTDDYTNPYMHRIAVQVSTYMIATGLEAILACVDDDGLHYFGIEIPPFDLDYITAIAKNVERQVLAGRLDDTCSQADYPCPFVYLHDTREETEDDHLDTLAAELEGARRNVRQAEDHYKSVQALIREGLGERESVRTASYTVTRYTQTTRRLDEKAVADAGIDLTPFRTETTSDRLKVTPRRHGDEEGA